MSSHFYPIEFIPGSAAYDDEVESIIDNATAIQFLQDVEGGITGFDTETDLEIWENQQ